MAARQDVFQNIFGNERVADRQGAQPQRQYPIAHPPSRPYTSGASREDPYRTRSLQSAGQAHPSMPHPQQQQQTHPASSSGAPQAVQQNGFRGMPPGHLHAAQQGMPLDRPLHLPGGRMVPQSAPVQPSPYPGSHRSGQPVLQQQQQQQQQGYPPHAQPQRMPSESYFQPGLQTQQAYAPQHPSQQAQVYDYDRAQSLQYRDERPMMPRPGASGRTASMGYLVQHPQDVQPPQAHAAGYAQPQSAYPEEYGSNTGSRRPTDHRQENHMPPVEQLRLQPRADSRHPPSGTILEEPGARASQPNRSFSSSTQATQVGKLSDSRSYSMTSTSTKVTGDRTFSFSASTTTLQEKRPSYASNKSAHAGASSQAVYTTSKRAPMVYPALLSRVADAFRQKILLSEKHKDGLSYKDAFLGCDAVDVIAYIIKTTDRNLALLLGRALDAQKFIHDVTYDHRLRDSAHEVYQFRDNLTAGFSDDQTPVAGQQHAQGHPLHASASHDRKRPSRAPTVDSVDSAMLEQGIALRDPGAALLAEDDLPNGVFTLLTECYSPTCTRDRLCYSIACPRRLEQQARLNMRPTPGLKRAESRGSLSELADGQQDNKLWQHMVSPAIFNTVDEEERKRQEVICEAIYTERDFVKDLEYLRDFWIKPLKTGTVIPEARRDRFVRSVFSNVLEVHNVNSRLAEALTHRQHAQPVIQEIGDIFLEFIPHFDPFIKYGSQQLQAKFEFEREKSTNPAFAKFVEETERMKESRKLELNGYLTKPTTRLGRYPIILETIAKHTKDSNPDKVNIPKAVISIKSFLEKVNIEAGRASNRFELMQLQQQLVNKPGEPDPNLKLTDENRQLIHKGALKKKNVGNANAGTDASSDVQVFLFDHALLMVKAKTMNKRETLKVHRKPIPLELLVIQRTAEDLLEAQQSKAALAKRPSSSLLPGGNKSSIGISSKSNFDNTKGFAITFQHLGRRGYAITLYATTYINRKKWLEIIDAQCRALRERQSVFSLVVVCERYFTGTNKVQCVVPYDGGRKLIYGTDNGIYVSERKPNSLSRATPVRVLAIQGATQIDVIEEYGILLVLQDKTLVSFNMEALDVNDNNITNKRPKKVSSHATFFKAGVCLGRVLVCVVKSSVLSSTIKVFEPVDHKGIGKKQPAFRKLLAGGNDLKVFKEFYIPTESTSIHFLKSKLCVGCAKGFEVVSLENLETQSLLDPADSSLDLFQRRENVRPIAIYRLNGEFLLCYDEFAFYVNRNGWRARPEWVIHWEGICEATALHYPYILAFEPSFVEIYHVETGSLVQIVPGNHLRLVHEGRGKMGEGGEILIVSDGTEMGQDSVVSALSLSANLVSPTRDKMLE
ncbi:CNH domain-domain-containing protein [Protomyces lactucae-debilis]|uniref:CNH domain-domain-containing protein n=1 Tax=Protomyces lactucae-debilis TaxID=2754530 RepID=A0A1Y2F0J4_PROLT|nr:CNH domain-containing protein [Protomyces lactucae-debilis]ORY77360.1 CNH domain-domain-containing protein [Protomyces lactucae-debilis]